MIARQILEEREEKALAPYAAKAGRSRGRRHPESEHPYRTAFQRDRDRVVHSTAFRRLEYKTQVFVNHEGDYYRTRLTHSMEAAQIARTISRAMGLNEDLAEALALSHDLGHAPFGHAGQDALHACMAGHGGFEHNLQGLRVVELLERRYAAFPGLNLTFEFRESMRKHSVKPDRPVEPEYEPAWAPLLEGLVVDCSDSIAYDSHDLDDALKAGLIREDQASSLQIWKRAAERGPDPAADPELRMRSTVRAIIDLVVSDLVEESERRIAKAGVRGLEDVRGAKAELVGFSPAMAAARAELERFLHEEVYRHHRVVMMSEKAARFIRALFDAYTSTPAQLPPRFREWSKEVGVHRAVADYVAGMTDRYAQDEYRRLFHPFENIL